MLPNLRLKKPIRLLMCGTALALVVMVAPVGVDLSDGEISFTLPVADARGNGNGGGLGGPDLAAPSMLTDMADFLVTDFWTQFGTVPRKFNLEGSGTNFKSGVLHYNVSGFVNAGSAGTDNNGPAVDVMIHQAGKLANINNGAAGRHQGGE